MVEAGRLAGRVAVLAWRRTALVFARLDLDGPDDIDETAA
jgi:hypothetical protein